MVRPQFPDYGAFLSWPAEGHGWIHADDVSRVRQLIPSNRVFRRDAFDGLFYHYRYGHSTFRLRPCLWLPLSWEGFNIGDHVETIGLSLQRELFLARIVEMHYERYKNRIVYRLKRRSHTIPRNFTAHEIRLCRARGLPAREVAKRS